MIFTERHLGRIIKPPVCACLLLAFPGLVGCPVATSGLSIVNNSNVMIHAVYVSPVANRIEPGYLDHSDWGPNLIEGQTDLGYGTVITITGIPSGDYDLLAVGTHTPQYGGGLVRYTEWGVPLAGGCYRWELLPTAKSEDGAEDGTPGEALGVFGSVGEEPAVCIEYSRGG